MLQEELQMFCRQIDEDNYKKHMFYTYAADIDSNPLSDSGQRVPLQKNTVSSPIGLTNYRIFFSQNYYFICNTCFVFFLAKAKKTTRTIEQTEEE